MFIADLSYLSQVREREGLSSDQIGRGFHANKSDIVLAKLLDYVLQFLRIHVSFELVLAFCFESVIVVDLQNRGPLQFDMSLGRGEVVIRWDNITWLDEDFRKEVLCSSTLMSVHHMLESHHIFDRVSELIECHAAGVRVICV